jgi:hypothetical protein
MTEHKRRWFQFRLRTLFVIVAIASNLYADCFLSIKERQRRQHVQELLRSIESASSAPLNHPAE